MYQIKLTREHYVGTQRPIRLGLPIPEHTVPDVCFCSPMNSDPIVLNSFILRDALLNSSEFLAMIGLKVIDLTKEPHTEKEEPVKEPEVQSESKEKDSSKKKSKGVEDTWE